MTSTSYTVRHPSRASALASLKLLACTLLGSLVGALIIDALA
ncbi:hypothetical protein [Archangium sp.]|nr:hypothetical protein [Archangium sp.]